MGMGGKNNSGKGKKRLHVHGTERIYDVFAIAFALLGDGEAFRATTECKQTAASGLAFVVSCTTLPTTRPLM